jgi:hypothetical protein
MRRSVAARQRAPSPPSLFDHARRTCASRTRRRSQRCASESRTRKARDRGLDRARAGTLWHSGDRRAHLEHCELATRGARLRSCDRHRDKSEHGDPHTWSEAGRDPPACPSVTPCERNFNSPCRTVKNRATAGVHVTRTEDDDDELVRVWCDRVCVGRRVPRGSRRNAAA